MRIRNVTNVNPHSISKLRNVQSNSLVYFSRKLRDLPYGTSDWLVITDDEFGMLRQHDDLVFVSIIGHKKFYVKKCNKVDELLNEYQKGIENEMAEKIKFESQS